MGSILDDIRETVSETVDSILHPNDWHNWAGNQAFTPAKIFRPKDLGDIKHIVKSAKKHNQKIRCAASGHTWTSLSVTKGYLVLTENLRKIEINYNETLKTWTVTAEAGVPLKELDNALSEHDPPLTLNSATVLDNVTTGGVVATGSHGAKCDNATISDEVVSIQIVTGDGELHEFSDEIDPEEMSAARISLGLLGIIYKITFRVEPMFHLKMTDTVPDIRSDLTAANVKRLVTDSDSLEIFYWPFNTPGLRDDNDKLWVKRYVRTNEPAEKTEAKLQVERVFQTLGVSFGRSITEQMVKDPDSTPFISHLLFEAAINRNATTKVLKAPDAIHYQAGITNVHCECLEFSVKITDFSIAVDELKYIVKRIYEKADRGLYPMNLTTELRINKSSRSLMATTYDPDPNVYFLLIEVLAIKGTKDFHEFSIEFAERWIKKYEALPHWSKLWEHVPNIIPHMKKSYHQDNRLSRFDTVRAKYDPDELFFDNESLRNLFGR